MKMCKFFLKASVKSMQNFLATIVQSELKTSEWNILNPDRLIDLEINNMQRTSIISISRLRKRLYQGLIPISTIQKFPALVPFVQGFPKSHEKSKSSDRK